jgi:hypothetical protein
MVEPSIYDQLAKESFSDLTITQLNAGTSVTAVDQATINYWKGPLTLSRVLEASRTYAGGVLPIPEASGIETVTVDASGSGIVQPPGSEIWQIQGIQGTGQGGTATASIFWFNGSVAVKIDASQPMTASGSTFDYSATPPITGAQPLTLTNSLYLSFAEVGGTYAVEFSIAYHKVSL